MINNIVVEEKVNINPFVSENGSGASGFFVSGESVGHEGIMPPCSNTGAKPTKLLSALIDWVSFTVPISFVDISKVYSLLGLDAVDFVRMKKGLNGYLVYLRRGDIVILSDGQVEGMGTHVFMTGEGCRQYEFKHGDRWKELFRDVFLLGGHFTRVDVAIDDYKGFFTIEQVAEKVKRDELRTLFKQASSMSSYRLGECNGGAGTTVYFGSNTSRIKIRMYDKSKQMLVDYTWNRIEIEARDERANLLVQEIINTSNLGVLVAGVLKRYVNFIEPCSGDSNRSRWDVSKWWDDFLGDVEKVKLTVKKAQKTLNEVVAWVEKQVAPSLALIKEKYGRAFTSFMQYVLFDGKERWTPNHLAILQAVN